MKGRPHPGWPSTGSGHGSARWPGPHPARSWYAAGHAPPPTTSPCIACAPLASCGGGIPRPHEHETKPHISQVTTDELLAPTGLAGRAGGGGCGTPGLAWAGVGSGARDDRPGDAGPGTAARRQRQAKLEAGACGRARGVDGDQLATLSVGELTSDGQTQAKAARLPERAIVQAGELLEDPLALPGGHARPRILDGQYGGAADTPCLHPDLGAGRRVLVGVAEQVVEDLEDLVRVDLDQQGAADLDRDGPARVGQAGHMPRLAGEVGGVDQLALRRVGLERGPPRFGAGEELVDHVVES